MGILWLYPDSSNIIPSGNDNKMRHRKWHIEFVGPNFKMVMFIVTIVVLYVYPSGKGESSQRIQMIQMQLFLARHSSEVLLSKWGNGNDTKN